MSAAISRLILNHPKEYGYDDDDLDFDLNLISHLSLDANTPVAPRSNAPWMADRVNGFSSDGMVPPSLMMNGRGDDDDNSFGSYSNASPHAWTASHTRRYTTTGTRTFLPAASYVAETHSMGFSRISSSSDSNNRNTARHYSLRGLYDSGSDAELGSTPPLAVAAQRQQQQQQQVHQVQTQDQYYFSRSHRQGSLSSSAGTSDSFFNHSPERNPGFSAYILGDNKSYSDPATYNHPHHHRTTASGPNPSRLLTNEGGYASVDRLYPNINVNTRPGHRSSLSQSSTTSTSRHSDSQKSSALSTASSSPPKSTPNTLHNNNNDKNNGSPKKYQASNKAKDADASNKKGKPRQDKRTYASDPHQGPRPTDWMLSEETLRSRSARDARFAQIVAMGLTKGRTKAGWAQARRPGKRDRDAAKRKLREMEEEAERERLRALLNEGQPSTPNDNNTTTNTSSED